MSVQRGPHPCLAGILARVRSRGERRPEVRISEVGREPDRPDQLQPRPLVAVPAAAHQARLADRPGFDVPERVRELRLWD